MRCTQCPLLSCNLLTCGGPETADIGGQFPTLKVCFRVNTSHGRHTGELHPVFNDVVNVTVTEMLSWLRPKVRYTGILVRANRRGSSPIHTVTNCAPGQKTLPPLGERNRVSGERIVPTVFGSRNREVAYRPRNGILECARRRAGAESTPADPSRTQSCQHEQQQADYDSDFSDLHRVF